MKQELVILPDMYARRSAVFVLVVTGILVVLLLRTNVAGLNAVAALSFTCAITFCGLFSFETHISQSAQKVVRVWRLGGVIPLWRRTYPFDSLRGIQQLGVADAQFDIWQVGLVTAAGRFLMVTYFTSRNLKEPLSDAERFRNYLASILNVPVLEEEQEA